jgi:serine protease Do
MKKNLSPRPFLRQIMELFLPPRVVKPEIRRKLEIIGGALMLKRFHLLISLLAVIAMAVAVMGAVAGQKEKQKEKADSKEKQAANSDAAARQFLMLPQFGGEGSYLGVYLEEVTPDRVKELGLAEERGAIVMKVVEGSPAEKAGLKENDVVVSFNGRRVDSVRELQRLLGETPADRAVSIEVIRGGSHQTVAATLSKRSQSFASFGPEWNGQVFQGDEARKRLDEARKRQEELLHRHQEGLKDLPDFGNFSFVNPGDFAVIRGARLGISAESLTDQLAEYFGVKEGRGVLVAQVDEKGPAGKAGLKAGDVIVAIDNEKVDSVNSLVTAVSKKEGSISVKIIRNHAEQTVNVTLEKRGSLPGARSRASLAPRAVAFA